MKPAELISHSTNAPRMVEPAVIDGELHCALTGRPISPEEAYWAPPLITTRALLDTLIRILFTNPAALGQILFGEQPNMPYAPDVRHELASRRSVEQLKLLALLLVIAALLILPIVLIIGQGV